MTNLVTDKTKTAGWYIDPADSNMLRFYDGANWTNKTKSKDNKVLAGWYPDPKNAHLLRFFDNGWTNRIAPAPTNSALRADTSTNKNSAVPFLKEAKKVSFEKTDLTKDTPQVSTSNSSILKDNASNSAFFQNKLAQNKLEQIKPTQKHTVKTAGGRELPVLKPKVETIKAQQLKEAYAQKEAEKLAFTARISEGNNTSPTSSLGTIATKKIQKFDLKNINLNSLSVKNLGKKLAPTPVRGFANGVFLIGLLATAYVLWTLFGTNITGDLNQRDLNGQLAASEPASSPAPSATKEVIKGKTVIVKTAPTLPKVPAEGQPMGHIVIPRLGVDYVFVAGTSQDDLAKGPGVWLSGAIPGTPGNATMSGHRTTHGGFFRHVDELKTGDHIIIRIPGQPDATYEVRGQFVVHPSDVKVTANTPGVRLTLTTCDPVGSDAARRVVQAELISGAWVSKALPSSKWHTQQ